MRKLVILTLVPAACGAFAFWGWGAKSAGRTEPPRVEVPAVAAEAPTEQVREFCGVCHASPPPDSFPRSMWRKEVRLAYDFFRESHLRGPFPPLEAAVHYYEQNAPEQLPALAPDGTADASPLAWRADGYALPVGKYRPGVTNVHLAHLYDPRKLDVLVCDARYGLVLALKPYTDPPAWQVLARLAAPAHTEVVDLDGDGIKDILVADLGSFMPTNDRLGKVVWLRGAADGTFTPVTLLDGVGRVADVRAADFNGDGKLDLVVGVFGWRRTGEILYLENRTTDWAKPAFTPRVVDDRHGTIHVPVCDLNKDGKPDFVALVSQEHEAVVAFLNEGGGRFRKEIIYEAPHPAYGSSGIELVDFDGDGDLDVLYSNGDVMDSVSLLRPDHGVQWLENRGQFPFVRHPLLAMHGVERAVAADLDGDGKLDVVASTFLPAEYFPQCLRDDRASLVWLRQTGPGRFSRHVLEKQKHDHLTCAAGDVFGDGRVHIVTGSHFLSAGQAPADAVTLWRNLGPARAPNQNTVPAAAPVR